MLWEKPQECLPCKHTREISIRSSVGWEMPGENLCLRPCSILDRPERFMSHHIGHPHFHCLRACLANKWEIDEIFVENFCANREDEKQNIAMTATQN